MKGKVKWFSKDRGYGFITSAEGKDIFVHYSAIQESGFKNLSEGQEVEFEVIQTERGDQAVKVVKI